MLRYFLRIAFNGSRYFGWQKQKGQLSVQQVLEECLLYTSGQRTEITGCGRTDTGVHATMFWVHFNLQEVNDYQTFLTRLNRILPEDIVALELRKVAPEAHARFDAISRTYKYRINTIKDPFSPGMYYYRYGEFNLHAMNEACRFLIGKHDFSSFCKKGSVTRTNFCKVTEAEWREEQGTLTFTISADRFLRNMVRAITGTMVKIGQGKLAPTVIPAILEGRNRNLAGDSLPGKGLFLCQIAYPAHIFLHHE